MGERVVDPRWRSKGKPERLSSPDSGLGKDVVREDRANQVTISAAYHGSTAQALQAVLWPRPEVKKGRAALVGTAGPLDALPVAHVHLIMGERSCRQP